VACTFAAYRLGQGERRKDGKEKGGWEGGREEGRKGGRKERKKVRNGKDEIGTKTKIERRKKRK
jgi:hypothetical protein